MKLLFHPVWNFSFTQVVLIVSSFLQNDLLDAPSKSFHWTAITIYNASALVSQSGLTHYNCSVETVDFCNSLLSVDSSQAFLHIATRIL